jgi:predicted HicB family RNase H-like nuclease
MNMDDKVIRIDEELHSECKARAALDRMSLKEWVEQVLRLAVGILADEAEIAAEE